MVASCYRALFAIWLTASICKAAYAAYWRWILAWTLFGALLYGHSRSDPNMPKTIQGEAQQAIDKAGAKEVECLFLRNGDATERMSRDSFLSGWFVLVSCRTHVGMWRTIPQNTVLHDMQFQAMAVAEQGPDTSQLVTWQRQSSEWQGHAVPYPPEIS